MIRAEASHLSVMAIRMNSLEMRLSPNMTGKEIKSRETQHFMKYGRLTLRVISHTCQYGLGDSVDHSGDEGVSLYCSSCWLG